MQDDSLSAEKPRRQSFLILFVEIFSLVTAGSFVLSALMLWAVFSLWQLDFFSLGTPSDVLMSGLSLGLRIVPILLVGWAFFAIPTFLRPKVWVCALTAAFALCLLRFAVTWTYRQFFIAPDTSWIAYEAVYALNVLLPGQWLFLGMFLAIIVGGLLQKFNLLEVPRKRNFAIIGLSIIALCMFVMLTQQLGRVGFQTPGLRLANSNETCSSGYVLWVGDRSTVVRCGSTAIFVLPTEGLQYEPTGISPYGRYRNSEDKSEWSVRREYRLERERTGMRERILEWRRDEERKLNQERNEDVQIADDYDFED